MEGNLTKGPILKTLTKLAILWSWKNGSCEKGYLTDTCLTAQDRYKAYLDYFRIEYNE